MRAGRSALRNRPSWNTVIISTVLLDPHGHAMPMPMYIIDIVSCVTDFSDLDLAVVDS